MLKRQIHLFSVISMIGSLSCFSWLGSLKAIDGSPPSYTITSRDHRSWFAASINGSPTRYLNEVGELLRELPATCLPLFRSGDLLRCTQNHISCTCEVQRLDGQIRLSLGLKISLNHDPAAALEEIRGLGPRTAQAIVDGRPWLSLTSLTHLRGVGTKRLNRLGRFLSLNRPQQIWPIGEER